jgi:hypothetical protein
MGIYRQMAKESSHDEPRPTKPSMEADMNSEDKFDLFLIALFVAMVLVAASI